MGGASSVPLRKRHFSLEIASYRERATLAGLGSRTDEEAAYPKAGALTLPTIKSVVEAFGEGESSPAMAPGGQGIRTAVRTQAVETVFDSLLGNRLFDLG